MKRCTLLMMLGALLLSSCSSAPIPQKKMMNIYYEMFTIDPLISGAPDLRAQTDSMSVYGGILERHGYTVENYLDAVDYYLKKPEAFARMMKKVQMRINNEITKMEAEEQRRIAEREAEEAATLAETDSTGLQVEDADDPAVSDTIVPRASKRRQPMSKQPVQWN